MNYQRVLYVDKFTSELKSKLRIVDFHRKQSLKSNVYFVKFASNADMEYADRACKRLRDLTLKPFQLSSFKTQHEHQIGTCSHREALTPSSSSSIPSLSPATTLTFLSDFPPSSITCQPGSLRRPNETLEERAMRVLGPIIASRESVVSTPTLQSINLNKKQLVDHIQSCLSAMKTAQRAADELYQLHRHRLDYCMALNYLIKVHSTAFYLKAATSTQIKDALIVGLRISRVDVAKLINAIKMNIRREQLFIEEMASTKHILSKIDTTASIEMSSKLAYQLTKISS
ncbi:unnamed protein product [Rotaria socialis]|uniref:Uncharacterized protein n=1 Tax=Rotaria socialis TaxID=392032 RepID=A0A819C7P2_9BILA|nr:unnamed protein product [Rotaria socialis]CAF3808078.1 unnamed protein product [Rotaria socialis]CAF4526995.1 unnamed protein product [Rotaria socialis]CAF4879682.1 unnamed protein product [Rotaria socialis]